MSEIIIRKADWQDCDDLFRWRNDEGTRKASFHSDPISYEDHKDWFEKSLRDPNRYIYIAEDSQGNKIGVVRLDKRGEMVAEFDINLAPQMRGRGFGAVLIADACEKFVNEAEFQGVFLARAKKDNPASISVFKKTGFFETFDYVDARWGGGSGFGQTFGWGEFST